MKKFFTLLAAGTIVFLSASNCYAQDTLIHFGSVWKYLDNGSDQGTAWQATAFNDASWMSGAGQLGYGDNDETTVVNGGTAGAYFITTYFRKTFTVADASLYSGYTLRVIRDDGVILYSNGAEVFLNNASSASTYTTVATATVGGTTAQENTPILGALSASVIVTGSNTFAAEIHQVTAASSDISFDLELVGILSGNGIHSHSPINNFSMKVYPTYFSDKATIEYRTPSAGKVQLKVYDVTGKEVMSLFNGAEQGGVHKIDLARESSLTPGLYFVKLSFNEYQIIQKISVLNN